MIITLEPTGVRPMKDPMVAPAPLCMHQRFVHTNTCTYHRSRTCLLRHPEPKLAGQYQAGEYLLHDSRGRLPICLALP